MYKVLFVCSGSTCRSPMASILFNRKLAKQNIANAKSDFCGLFVEYGSTIMPEAKIALKEYGIKRVVGEPKQITGRHLAEHNLIICVTEDHKQALQNMAASKFADKIVCFKDVCGINLYDPYGKDLGAYQKCLAQIDTGLDKLISVLLAQNLIKRKRSRNV